MNKRQEEHKQLKAYFALLNTQSPAPDAAARHEFRVLHAACTAARYHLGSNTRLEKMFMCGDIQASQADTEPSSFRCGPLQTDPESEVMSGAELGAKAGGEAAKIASELWKPAEPGTLGPAASVVEVLRKMAPPKEAVPIDQLIKQLEGKGLKKIDLE